MTESVLVTGGAGFVGSTIASRLLAEGYDVVVVDNLVTGFVSNVLPGCEFIEAETSMRDAWTMASAQWSTGLNGSACRVTVSASSLVKHDQDEMRSI